jgi:hypothetical protein
MSCDSEITILSHEYSFMLNSLMAFCCSQLSQVIQKIRCFQVGKHKGSTSFVLLDIIRNWLKFVSYCFSKCNLLYF